LLLLAFFLSAFNVSAQPAKADSQNQQGAHGEHHHHMMATDAAQPAPPPTARPAIPDTPVLDQDGRRLSFYSDLVKGKVVAINFIFTTCTTICPPLGATFAKVGELGGEHFGADFQLISISVDPTTDTPQRLKAWAAKFNAKPGWTLVTGRQQDIDALLKALGGFSASPRDHTPTVLIIGDSQGVMTRAYGLAPPAKLLSIIDAAGKGVAADASAHAKEEKR
ncbi:MAG TPA: SCO family protein, partial [Blastocatellia bacterium]|nr:SCO family protein [Blastocatellia bacterium]